MSTERWMDTEFGARVYNGRLLSCEREHLWVSPKEVDEPRAYHTEGRESERERQVWYIDTYIWNLERGCWWAYLQTSYRDSWRRKWQPTPVFLPGKSHGRRNLVGYKSMGSQRVGHDWATSLYNGDSDIDKRLVDSVWEGEDGTNWESCMETYPVLYVK